MATWYIGNVMRPQKFDATSDDWVEGSGLRVELESDTRLRATAFLDFATYGSLEADWEAGNFTELDAAADDWIANNLTVADDDLTPTQRTGKEGYEYVEA